LLFYNLLDVSYEAVCGLDVCFFGSARCATCT